MPTKLTHTDLLKLGHTLGYKLTDNGLCHGFSGMLSQAWLSEDENTFVERLKLIETYNTNFDQLKKDIDKAREQGKGKSFDALDDRAKKLLEILAFYEGIELYLNPEAHQDLFATNQIFQGSMGAISSFARSNKMERDKNELSIALNKPYAFNKQNLVQYLQDFEKVLGDMNIIAPLVLKSHNHSVCLRYDLKNKKWLYVDTNDFQRYPDSASYTRELDSNGLTDSIFRSFFCENHLYTVFNTLVISKSSQQKSLESVLDVFNTKYPMKPEQAKIYDPASVGLLFLACMDGNLDMVLELLKQGGNVNQARNDGVTALYVACESGHLDIVLELLKQTGIDVNQAINNGVSPFYIACQYGHTNIVALLIDSKRLNSIDQIGLENHTPLLVACLSPHTHGKKELFELLLKNGASLTHKNDKNETALDIAVRQNNTAAIEAIKEWISLEQKSKELKLAQNANAITESRKGITQEELQSTVLKALTNYSKLHRADVNSRTSAGFFVPSSKDLASATECNHSIRPEQNLSLADTVVTLKNFLGDPSRSYDHHSFATFLAEALADRRMRGSYKGV